MDGDHKIRVGSRKSELALIQTRHVISLLKGLHPDKEFEIVTMSTLGDQILDIPLPKIGEKSLFTKELEIALATGLVDFVVHSLKDLPTALPEGMAIGAVLSREDPRDALVLHKDYKESTLETLKAGSTIGTSSLRRTAQLARNYPHLKVENIRGNLNTRLKKLDEMGKYQGLILAAAGLVRMGWDDRISKIIENEELMYAVGQGALAVECKEADSQTISLLKPLYHFETGLKIVAERSFLYKLGGGCSAPVAVTSHITKIDNGQIKLILCGAVWSLDGTEEVKETAETTIEVSNGRCATCPLGYGTVKINIMDSCQTDIECLTECRFKKNSEELNDPSPFKKQKLNHENKNEVPIDLLKDDPHEHCPVDIPVGLDFMGKCPYLESAGSSSSKCPVNGTFENNNIQNITKCPVNGHFENDGGLNVTKCPFMKDGVLKTVMIKPEIKPGGVCPYREQKLFCGLVPHFDMPIRPLEDAYNLGVRLATTLMGKGATEIMIKAQTFIRSSS